MFLRLSLCVFVVSSAMMPALARAKQGGEFDIVPATEEVASWLAANSERWNDVKKAQAKKGLQELISGVMQIATAKRLTGNQFSEDELRQKRFLESQAQGTEQGLHRVKLAADKLDPSWRSRKIDAEIALSNALSSRNSRDAKFKSFSSYRISSAGDFRFSGKIQDYKAFQKAQGAEANELDALVGKLDSTLGKALQ